MLGIACALKKCVTKSYASLYQSEWTNKLTHQKGTRVSQCLRKQLHEPKQKFTEKTTAQVFLRIRMHEAIQVVNVCI